MKGILICLVVLIGINLASATFLGAHNAKRRLPYAANMRAMVWNRELATMARNWASKCIKGHNPNRRSSRFSSVGENIFWSSNSRTPGAAVNAWYSERQYYNYASNSCSRTCGHYTQVVWANSEYLGCARQRCSNFYIYVCNYGPAGNFSGQKPYVRGRRCSRCPRGYRCFNNLCVRR
ncbi:GLIPR1-like protein 1 [Saccostrea cucullata]|uniref:GLIPR1-like protein 1 n=1 Tax=Saccostrea cuccullata TaxID=36930 RepID=UPI002ED59DA5